MNTLNLLYCATVLLWNLRITVYSYYKMDDELYDCCLPDIGDIYYTHQGDDIIHYCNYNSLDRDGMIRVSMGF